MKKEVYFGLPSKVKFCKKTLISNQRPSSEIEFKHNKKTKKKTLHIDKNFISDTWKYSRIKKKINYKKREEELLKLLDKHRNKHGEYDCIVPGSGGKDSCYATDVLKRKYGMNPLSVTWPPIIYTQYGFENFKNWIKTGKIANISAARNEDVLRILTQCAFKNLLHPFQSFIIGQKIFPIKIALKKKIPLIFYGENEAEHGNAINDNATSLREKSFHSYKNINDIYFGGLKIKELNEKFKISIKDLDDYLPPQKEEFEKSKIEVHYLGYYLRWIPQECFYYSVENCGFKPRPYRSQGTYSKYNSIDDKFDDINFYTMFNKFGIGRATYDVSQELRNDHLSVEEGKKLIKKYDGEFPNVYIKDVLDYLDISMSFFKKKIDEFKSPHLWKKTINGWKLRHTVNKDGVDD
jgi:N-acetyl sugar amidotransferase